MSFILQIYDFSFEALKTPFFQKHPTALRPTAGIADVWAWSSISRVTDLLSVRDFNVLDVAA
jgi:hypothetical protein